MNRGGNRPDQVLKGLSLVYDKFLRPEPSLSKAFILVRSDLFKSLVWSDNLFKSFLHIKSLIFLHGKGETLIGFHHEEERIYA